MPNGMIVVMGWLRRWWWAGPRVLAWLGACLLVVAAVVAAGLFAAGGWSTSRAGNEAEFTRLVDVSQIASAGMAAVGLALSLVSVLVGARRSSSQRRADAAADLDTYRGKVHEFWNVEARHGRAFETHTPSRCGGDLARMRFVLRRERTCSCPTVRARGSCLTYRGGSSRTRATTSWSSSAPGAGKSAALVLLTVELTHHQMGTRPYDCSGVAP